MNRFFLDQDSSCHWYLIPLEKAGEWSEFMDIPDDDERSWQVPEWAKMIDGYSSITFADPQDWNTR